MSTKSGARHAACMVPDGPSLLFVSSPFSSGICLRAGSANSCIPTVLIVTTVCRESRALHGMTSQISFLRVKAFREEKTFSIKRARRLPGLQVDPLLISETHELNVQRMSLDRLRRARPKRVESASIIIDFRACASLT